MSNLGALAKLFGARTGATLAKMQEEQNALAELKKKFPGPFVNAEELDKVRVKHASPHAFDKFRFRDNLLKGEGAIAYGPGGYTSGNGGTVGHYIRQFKVPTPAVIKAGPLADAAYGAQKALKKDTDAALAALQARALMKYEDDLFKAMHGENKFAHSRYVENASRLSPDHDYRVGYRRFTPEALEMYDVLPGYVKNALSPLAHFKIRESSVPEFLDMGRDVLAATEEMDRSKVKLEPIRGAGWTYNSRYPTPRPHQYLSSSGEDPKSLVSLSSVARTLEDDPSVRVPKYVLGMGSEYSLGMQPLSQLKDTLSRWDGNPTIVRPASKGAAYLYDAELNVPPNEMLVRDLPYLQQSDHVKGALQRIFSEDFLRTNPAGGAFLSGDRDKAVENMDKLREAGIRASMYLRGGYPRKAGVGYEFNPEDWNFIIHDDDAIDIINRTEKAEGGLVTA